MSILMRSLCLLLPFTLTGCQPAEQAAAELVRPVKVFTVQAPHEGMLREFPARLKAPEEAQLSFRLGGELRELRVREGEKVKAGQVLAELDDTDIRLRLSDREASFELSRAQLQRMRQLLERQAVSQSAFDERQAQFNSAEAALNLSRQELAYSRLSAPFTGLVARTHVERFQIVQPNQPIITLYAGDSMDVVFQLPESLLSSLRADLVPGDYQPQVRLDTLAGRILPAVYKEHSSQPDPRTLTYQVVLSMPLPEELVLLPGMSATVLVDFAGISRDAGRAIRVPVEAVFSPDSQSSAVQKVWVLHEEDEALRVSARQVQVGQLGQDGIEVLSGLQPGERIVAVGGSELSEGQRVRLWERERGL